MGSATVCTCSGVTWSCDPAYGIPLTCEWTSHDWVTPLHRGCFRLVVLNIAVLFVSRLSSFTACGCHLERWLKRTGEDILRLEEVIAERDWKGLAGGSAERHCR